MGNGNNFNIGNNSGWHPPMNFEPKSIAGAWMHSIATNIFPFDPMMAATLWNVGPMPLAYGFGWGDVARLITYVGSLLITAIMSFTSGEKIQKVYKTEFYIELSQFIERFYEWDKKHE